MDLKQSVSGAGRFLPSFPVLVMAGLLATAMTAQAEEELAATGPHPAARDLGQALGPDAMRQIHRDATIAQAELAAELRAELAVIAKPSLGNSDIATADQEAQSHAAEPVDANPHADEAPGAASVQSRTAIEHTRVFLMVRAQRAHQGVLVQ